jgi:hypothetical protein
MSQDTVTEAIKEIRETTEAAYKNLHEVSNATLIDVLKEQKESYHTQLNVMESVGFSVFRDETNNKETIDKVYQMLHRRQIPQNQVLFNQGKVFLTRDASKTIFSKFHDAKIDDLNVPFLDKKILNRPLDNTPMQFLNNKLNQLDKKPQITPSV